MFQRLSKDININLSQETINQLNNKLNAIKQIKDIVDANVINIFNKDNVTVYTVRYYLTDTKQFNSNDLENIAKQVEQAIN